MNVDESSVSHFTTFLLPHVWIELHQATALSVRGIPVFSGTQR